MDGVTEVLRGGGVARCRILVVWVLPATEAAEVDGAMDDCDDGARKRRRPESLRRCV